MADMDLQLIEITESWMPKMISFCQGVFPIVYPKIHFEKFLEKDLCRILVDGGEIQAIVCCQEEFRFDETVMYIQQIGVIPYMRDMGLGSQLLQFVELKAMEAGLDKVGLHVQTDNHHAIRFYTKRGFETKQLVVGCYKRSTNPDGYYMLKILNKTDD